jgi:hypothetical protein
MFGSEADELISRALKLREELELNGSAGAMLGAYYNIEEIVFSAREKQKQTINFIRTLQEQDLMIAVK